MGKPWDPEHTFPGGEKQAGYIQLGGEDCAGCGFPSVLGHIRSFPIQGFPEFCASWPVPRRYRAMTGSGHDTRGVDDGPGDEFCPGDESGNCPGSAAITNAFEPNDTQGAIARWIPDPEADCLSLMLEGRCSEGYGLVEKEYSSNFPSGIVLDCWDGASPYDMVAQRWTTPGYNYATGCTPTSRDGVGFVCVGGGDCGARWAGHDVLSEEDTFADAAARASAGLSKSSCWPEDAFLHPLAPRIGNPWDCRVCGGLCPDEVAYPGHSQFWPAGIHRGQGGGSSEIAQGDGCIRPLFCVAGQGESQSPAAQAAKYRIVVPYEAALENTQFDVTWLLVRRANMGQIVLKDQAAAGVTAEEVWRKTVMVGSWSGESFSEGSGPMTGPHDDRGSMAGGDASWDEFGWEVIEGILSASGVPGELAHEERALYKFVLHGGGNGSVSWQVNYLDGSLAHLSSEQHSESITDGESAVFGLVASAGPAGVYRAVISNIQVTVDGAPVDRGVGTAGQWMLQAKRRSGRWGFAELDTPSDPPKFYPARLTRYEYEVDGGSGHCTDGCVQQDGNPGPGLCDDSGKAAEIHATEETVETLSQAESTGVAKTRTKDQIVDGNQDDRTLRWGREFYAPGGSGDPLTSNESGRPEYHWPFGCVDPEDAPDPYVETVGASADTKTKAVREETRTRENTRLCGAVVASIPDPQGAVLEVTPAAATTINEEDSTSIARLRATVQPGLEDTCIDYGNEAIGDGAAQSVANEAARLASTAYDEVSCPGGAWSIGAKVHQLSDDTFWELISIPETPCAPLTEEHWRQLRYKTTPVQNVYTPHATSSVWIENIVVSKQYEVEEEEPEE